MLGTRLTLPLRLQRPRVAAGVLLLVTLLAGCRQAPPETAHATDDCDALVNEYRPLLDASWSTVTRTPGIAGRWVAARRWIERQLVTHDQWVALGWCEVRLERIPEATKAFVEANGRVRHSTDAEIGLGYIALRRNEPSEGVRRFSRALELMPASSEAREGLRLALERLPVGDAAASDAREVLRQVSRRAEARPSDDYLLVMADRRSGGSGELRRRGDVPSGSLAFAARSGQDYLEIRNASGTWQPLFVQGINIGPALPGHFASDAPEDVSTWVDWLDRIAGLGANAVRVYTLQPPAFYRALATHNLDPGRPRLWLLQGVWADLPPDDNFGDQDYVATFEAEIARVIDAVHGDLVLDPARGTARGIFDTDVSAFTLGWIIGREWEPYAVVAFEDMNPGTCRHDGQFVSVPTGRAMECWIGRVLDFGAAYEARRYAAGRPLAFANWPTLDPLRHPTEATQAEEDRWRHKLTGAPLPDRLAPTWDDDAATVDATRIAATAAFPPGVFASYHVYPNYPYFMNLEPSYAKVRDESGPNRYAGYLRALKAYHNRQPVLVAEFGMSTSRGIAHLQTDGLHHGGHDEAAAMRYNARLLHSIHDERLAGGIAFEFMDEWFKGTWSTSPFEIPEEHRPRWFNAESPEQSYGLFAQRPEEPVRVDGDPAEWAEVPTLASRQPEASDWNDLWQLKARHDAGWVYLLLRTSGTGVPDWRRTALSVGFDTYDPARGERRLLAPANCDVPTGVEFALSIRGPGDTELMVTPPYRQRHPAESGLAMQLFSPLQPTGSYRRLSLETNRERYTRAGQHIGAQQVDPGRLRYGSMDPSAPDFDTRTDIAVGPGGAIEIRLPWALLNFADPSTASVLHSPVVGPTPGTVSTPGIRLHACSRASGSAAATPALSGDLLAIEPWTLPRHSLQEKHGLDQLKEAFRSIAGTPPRQTAGIDQT